MAARKKSSARKTSRKKTTGRAASRRPGVADRATAAIARLEKDMPDTLAQFSRTMRTRLNELERQIQRAGARARARFTKLLRDASHALGRYEAQGERQWRKLTRNARADALRLLKRLEAALEGDGGTAARGKKTSRKKTARRKTARKPAARKTTARRSAGGR